MLVHLTERDIRSIISLAELNNANHPPDETGAVQAETPITDAHCEALKKAIAALPREAVKELVALFSFGCGNSLKDRFHLQVWLSELAPDAGDVDFIVERSSCLPDYLRIGLQRLGSN